MRIWIVGTALMVIATAAALAGATPQTQAPSDPVLVDARGFQKLLQEHRGKPLMVNFWATWCEPCRDEYPMLNELAKTYGPKGFQFVGVSLDDDGDLILMRRFLARYKPVFPNYRKKPGDDMPAFRQSVLSGWTGSMPVSIFYTKDGKQAGNFLGEKNREQYEQIIQALLAGGTPTRD